MRAADGGESARFTGIFLASSFFCSQAFIYARPLSAANASRWAAIFKGTQSEMNVSKETQKLRFFEAHCADCSESFGVPLLSDFAYGEFILNSEDGKAFAYLNAIVEKNYDLISDILKEFGEEKNNRELPIGKYGLISTLWAKIKPEREVDYYLSCSYIDRLQWTVARCADEIGGHKLTTRFICPNCQSTNVRYSNAVVVKDEEIPVVTFDAFNALSEIEKRERVRELFDSSRVLF